MTATPRGPRPQSVTWGRAGLYAFSILAAAFFLLPVYIVLSTSLKSIEEIRTGNIFALPSHPSLDAWATAWSGACTGFSCSGVGQNFWNSVAITVPAVILGVGFAAVNGFALSFWRVRGAQGLLGLLLVGAFIPYQLFLYPLVRMTAATGLFGTIAGAVVVHVIFSVPILTLLFRNFYVHMPVALYNAARVDGAGFWRIFARVFLPMSGPIIIVACILHGTGVWNDFLVGLVFAGRENMPMTVQLNNLVNTTDGAREYNVEMAATVLTAAVPALVYFASGKWFVRGVMAGAMKG